MSYQEKYLKYKNKYLRLKSLIGGDKVEECKGKNWDHFLNPTTKSTGPIVDELIQKIANDTYSFTIPEIHTYLEALNGYWARYHACHTLEALRKNVPEQTCITNLFKISKKPVVGKLNLFEAMTLRWKNIPGITSVNSLIALKAPDYHKWYMSPTHIAHYK